MIMAKVNFKNLTKLKLALNFIRDKIKRTSSIKRGVEVQMPTSYGKFKLIPFLQIGTKKEHVVLFKGDLTDDSPLLVRMHSSCATGDIFHRCAVIAESNCIKQWNSLKKREEV